MASYTSTQNGDWGNANTWAETGFPNAAGDTVTVRHNVTYNSKLNVGDGFGDITIASNGILIH